MTNAVGLQALAINVERYLLLLFAKQLDIRYRRDTTQTIGEVVAILFQLAIATLVALDGNEQRRGVTEVVVHHDGQHATGQLRLKAVQPVLDFRPHLVLVVHVVVQFHHHDTHAVLRLRGGFCAIHLAIGKEVTLQWTSHLLLHLLAGGTRIHRHYHSLTDSCMREFVLWHDVHAVDTHHKQYAYDEQCY